MQCESKTSGNRIVLVQNLILWRLRKNVNFAVTWMESDCSHFHFLKYVT